MSNKKLTTEEFIDKAKTVHEDRYDYSLVNYKSTDLKIKIICKEHGIFEQTPYQHYRMKQGCSKCSMNRKLTTEEFIIKANEIHNKRFNYTLSNYQNKHKKIKIICEKHGIFEQSPNSHLKGIGCAKCAKRHKHSTEEFIEKSKIIHNNKYDYSESNYISGKKDINILCPKHGLFKQKAQHHLSGHGCPICTESIGEKTISIILDKNKINYIRQKTFEKCRKIKKLPFDFFIPELNICIEYDGIHHFKALDFFGGEESFKQRKKCDRIKTKFCKDNNIKLLRIKYTENIENKLTKDISGVFF